MEFVYLTCLLVSLGMLFWLKIFEVKNSVSQYITLLILVISNLGFYFVSISTTVEEAIIAQKMTYFAGSFLPVFYFLLVLEICHIEISRWVNSALLLIQCVVYGFACTIGKNDLYYKNVSFYIDNGNGILAREYGPLHIFYPITMYFYMAAALIVTLYALAKNRSINRRGVISMVVLCFIAIGTYAIERAMNITYDFSPVANDLLMIGALIPVFKSNLYTVYEKKDIINEQLGQKGFLTFDKKRTYQNANDYIANVFPELSNYRIGQKIEGCSKELQALLDQIDIFENHPHDESEGEHCHNRLEAFWLDGKYYEGFIHS
ncbi:MAG: histidine kinase N-terminal 7TM domain-containing protein, partial [Prevotellaceae bacterium]|nr:histidine kinase N-terminal 7TM domain-containing protein [Prevotellaceae bacterium]